MRNAVGSGLLLLSLSWPVGVAAASNYAQCAGEADSPSCLVARAASDSDDTGDVLDAVVMAGAIDVIAPHAARLAQAVNEQGTAGNAFAAATGIKLPLTTTDGQMAAADRPVAWAALALAAAAHASATPFEHPIVKALISKADNSPAIAVIASSLWGEADTYGEWAGYSLLTRPRGMRAIWQAIVARPPTSASALVDLANNASAHGYRTEGLMLLRIAMTRSDLTNENEASIASQLARWHRLPDEAQRMLDAGGAQARGWHIPGIRTEIARARLHGGYDAIAAKAVFDDSMADLNKEAFYSDLGLQNLDALEEGKAKRELIGLGKAYLARARQANPYPQDQGQWFALASEALRRGGAKTQAIEAAREGLAFVPLAVARRIAVDDEVEPIEDKRAAAVNAGPSGTAPVIALYRAGARDEAIATGFLTGFDRYRNAERAGETRDPRWVVEDRSSFYVEILIRELIATKNAKDAARMYDELRCAGIYGKNYQDHLHRALALLAAVAGQRRSMDAHLAMAAKDVESGGAGATADTRAYFALRLAVDWRRALTIAERVNATADAPLPAPCPRT